MSMRPAAWAMVGTWPGSRSNWLRTSPATPLPRAAQLHQLLALAYERGCRVWIGSRQRFGEQMGGELLKRNLSLSAELWRARQW
ncbi:hypothetical protein PP299_22495 [Mycobacteroides abscessus]|uniref:hypothetical protein n=1 Tax=Mycobacteroides abscessus TaxID=36809 RepID=UPI0002E3674F|nr:hypothetical protein [Mycobacteroides abscessus]MDM1898389.1 hypothetical protein [Mycobacteroides abscessus]MDM1907799.1 hypothetical protein [Mycobacteroides abscessus]MDM1912639.1 hypothetical protein [Mycobacteroides abscessus]MDM1922854.1 hypothetical protein [Mycobacteroides abscessus]